jgi:CD63 antigen
MLVLIFLAEIAIGVAGYLKHKELASILQNGFDKTLSEYNRSTDAQRAWSFVQTEMECCGINGPKDWEPIYNNETVPRSCCPNLSTQETQCTQSRAYDKGCMPKLLSFLDSKSLILAAVGLGIALAQLLGVIFACCLSRSFRVNYETV